MLRQIIFISALALAAQAAHAAEAGKVIFVAGQVSVADQPIALGGAVNEGQLISTGADGYVYIKTIDNGLFILRPSTKARIAAYHVDRENPANTRVKLELLSGVARSQSGEAVKQARQNFRFNTPVAAIGVRGTDFTVFTDQNTSRVAVLSGAITVSGFGNGCSVDGGGPCEGGASRELNAAQKGKMLQIQRGAAAPQLMPGSGALAPDVLAPPRADEPAAKSASTTEGTGTEPSLDPKKNQSLLTQIVAAVVPTVPSVPGTPVVVAPEAPAVVDPVAPVVVPPVVIVEPPLRAVSWGRWQPVLDQAANATLTKAGAERLAYNGFYVLFREKQGAAFVVPERGSVGFALAQSEAVVFDQTTLRSSAATLENAKLLVDFGGKSFTTSFDLLNQSERFQLQSQGTLGTDGRLYGESQIKAPTNMDVDGVLNSTSAATYIFQSQLGKQRVASGVTYWTKK